MRYDVDDIIARAAAGEFGTPGIGADAGEFGYNGVGDELDEFGASGASGVQPMMISNPFVHPVQVAQQLARKAQAGRVTKADIASVIAMLHGGNCGQPSRLPQLQQPFPGFGGPSGPGKGSVGVPVNIGSTAGTAAGAAAAALTLANPRLTTRIKRVLIQATGISSGIAFNGLIRGTVTGMTAAGFPLVAGGAGGSETYAIDNQSPPGFNQLWPAGTPFTILLTAQPGRPATQIFTVTVIVSSM